MAQQRMTDDNDDRVVYRQGPSDAGGAAMGAATLIQTIVWSVVVLVILAVALYALHVYVHLF